MKRALSSWGGKSARECKWAWSDSARKRTDAPTRSSVQFSFELIRLERETNGSNKQAEPNHAALYCAARHACSRSLSNPEI